MVKGQTKEDRRKWKRKQRWHMESERDWGGRAEKAKNEEEVRHYNALFTLQITDGDSSSAISALSQWSNRIISLFNRTAVWTASQLILMYCILGFNLIQNHSGWSLKCQLGLIPGIKYTSVTRRQFVLTFLSRQAEHRTVTWVRCGVTGGTKNVAHVTSTKLCSSNMS